MVHRACKHAAARDCSAYPTVQTPGMLRVYARAAAFAKVNVKRIPMHGAATLQNCVLASATLLSPTLSNHQHADAGFR